MRARTAASRLGDTQYAAYLDETIFRLTDVTYTREQANDKIGPSLTAVSRLNNALAKLDITTTHQLQKLGIGDLADTPGVGPRQLEVACCILAEAGRDVAAWIDGWGKSHRTAAQKAVKRGAKRKAGKRAYRKSR